ncbi:MAG: rRNA pseudouridine synthase [Bacteroidia bacterium]|nr:rRNA pseudouridine synthase [Bacteroidia bacterium]MDW8301075.1 pseudouridine synthase [Bacteroidia bacterium]
MNKFKGNRSAPDERKFDKDKLKQEIMQDMTKNIAQTSNKKNSTSKDKPVVVRKLKKVDKGHQNSKSNTVNSLSDKVEDNSFDPYSNFGNYDNIRKLAKKVLKQNSANFTDLKTQMQTLKRLQKLPQTEVRLNRYIAHCGICARREADQLIRQGKIKVNGVVVKELGKKINPQTDVVEYQGKPIQPKKFVYILMNKPKDCLCTLKDPKGRRTVIDIIGNATPDRVFPVGRLDRNTIGLLLLTNDGELAQRLMHPSYKIPKVYKVTLSEPLQKADIEAIRKGITLEDGLVEIDDIEYVPDTHKKQVVIQIHSGRNRVIRRLFEHLGYQIEKLDRIIYAGLTKRALPRGKFRFLTEEEIHALRKMVGLEK